MNSTQTFLPKELRRSDFLFDGGYVGARAPLLSIQIKKNTKKFTALGKINNFGSHVIFIAHSIKGCHSL